VFVRPSSATPVFELGVGQSERVFDEGFLNAPPGFGIQSVKFELPAHIGFLLRRPVRVGLRREGGS